MIRVNYINKYDIFDETEDFIHDQFISVESAIADYENLYNKMHEFDFVESVSDENEALIVEEGKNLIEKIGDAVIAAVNKVVTMINSVITNIKNMMTSHKDDTKKLDKLLKDHPELKNEVLLSLKQGDLDIKSLKDMNEYLDESYELVKKIESGKVTPSKAEDAYDKIVKKFEKAKPIFTGIAAVGSAVTAIAAIHKFLPTLKEQQMQSEIAKKKMELFKLNKNIEKLDHGESTLTGLQRVKNKIIHGVCAKVTGNFSKVDSANSKFSSRIYHFLQKFYAQEPAQQNLEERRNRVSKQLDEMNDAFNRGNNKGKK